MDPHSSVAASDFGSSLERVFYLPGDAFLAQIGSTPLGRFLDLTPAAFGTTASAVVSGTAWLLAVWALVYLSRFFLDAVDPTYRQQQRERREARAQLHRAQMRRRASWTRPFTRVPSRRTGRRPA